MGAFSIKANIHSLTDEKATVCTKIHRTGEFDTMQDAYLYLTRLAASLQGWIISSTIIPVNTETGEIKDPLKLLAPPVKKPCPIKDLEVLHHTRVPEVALRQPYTYKENDS